MFRFDRRYTGPVQLTVFDWAGTTIDFGCLAPAGAFQALFARHGLNASVEEARGPMGMHKRDHIRTMLGMPSLARQWAEKHGHPHTEADVEALFQEFIPMQLEVLPQYAKLIPGVAGAVNALRAQGIKIGGTTGYNAEMMGICAEAAAREGYSPDFSVAGSQVPAGRPAPWMAIRVAMELGVYPFESVVKVGDTVTDIQEGLNGCMWTVGITVTGNEVGLSEAEWAALSPTEQAKRNAVARTKLFEAGAHYVIDAVAELPPVVAEINARLARGERP